MKTDKFMYLPTMTEDEFVENIGRKISSADSETLR